MPAERHPLWLRTGSALALVLVLGACTAGGQFDPTEMVSSDIFNNKKRISGEREPVFPQGVPGAETGVPPDLVRGYQPPPEAPALVDNGAQATAKAAAAAEKQKPKKPRPKVAKVPAQQQPTRLGISRARRRPGPPAGGRRRNRRGRRRKPRRRPVGLLRPRAVNRRNRRRPHRRTGRLRRRPGNKTPVRARGLVLSTPAGPR